MDCEIMEYVELRLEQWAEWYTYHGNFGLGYPPKSPEYKLRETGGIYIRSSIKQYITVNSTAEEMEQLICELAKYNFKIADALRNYYFGAGKLKERARKAGISYSQYKVYVDMAKYWIAGRLVSSIYSHIPN